MFYQMYEQSPLVGNFLVDNMNTTRANHLDFLGFVKRLVQCEGTTIQKLEVGHGVCWGTRGKKGGEEGWGSSETRSM
jgi:hypothetical protein